MLAMKVHFTTLGCPKNQVDSELMLGMLAGAGHEIVPRAEAAECLVVNTCAFIDRAREESVNTILDLAKLKEKGRARALIVTGCLTQRYGQDILTEIPEVSAILGTSELPYRGAGEPGRRPPELGDRGASRLSLRRGHSAPPQRARALCVCEDRRGLR